MLFVLPLISLLFLWNGVYLLYWGVGNVAMGRNVYVQRDELVLILGVLMRSTGRIAIMGRQMQRQNKRKRESKRDDTDHICKHKYRCNMNIDKIDGLAVTRSHAHTDTKKQSEADTKKDDKKGLARQTRGERPRQILMHKKITDYNLIPKYETFGHDKSL